MAAQYKVPVFTPSGQVTDAFHKPIATLEYVDDELSAFDTGPPDYVDLPAKCVLVMNKSGGVWPGVPTDRADIVIIWRGATPAPATVSSRTLGQPGMLEDVDLGLFF